MNRLLLLADNYCPIQCPQIYEPVCGSDGSKYSSECFLRREACEKRKAITVIRNKAYAIHHNCGK